MIALGLQLVICLVTGLVAYVLLDKTWRSFGHGVIVAVVSQALLVFLIPLLTKKTFLYSTHSRKALVGLIALMVVVTVAVAFVDAALRGTFQIVKHRRQRTWKTWLVAVLCGLMGGFTGLFITVPLWARRNFGYLTADQVKFFMAVPSNFGGTAAQMKALISQVLAPTIALTVLGFLLALIAIDFKVVTARATKVFSAKVIRRTAISGLSLSLVLSMVFTCWMLPIYGLLRMEFVKSDFIEKHYVEPTDSILHFPEHPKNFVHIYLESMENSYYSKEEGGYLSQSLMPDFAELTKEGVTFSNRDGFGGPHQTPGANHSFAGMMNMHAGVPMLPRNSLSHSGLFSFPDFRTIGDILHSQGYNCEFLGGGDIHGYYWMSDYYAQHGDFQTFDIVTARKKGYLPKDYHVWWGMEDDKLYEFTKMELTRLSEMDKPFYVVVENTDTHNNDGYLSPKATEPPSSSQYGNVIYYSQQQVTKLIRWMQQQPWWKDTVVFLSGDHKSMDINFFKGWDQSYERTVVNILLNPAVPIPHDRAITHNRKYAPFDYFPTILAALGIKIDGDRLGLGTNLFSGKPTLIEQYGAKKVDAELALKSVFYNEHSQEKEGLLEQVDSQQQSGTYRDMEGGVGLTEDKDHDARIPDAAHAKNVPTFK